MSCQCNLVVSSSSDNSQTDTIMATTSASTSAGRHPIFVYDTESRDIDILCIPQHIMNRNEIVLEDLFTIGGTRTVIPISQTSPTLPHRLILHRNGHDFNMISVSDKLFQELKSHALPKVIVSHALKDVSNCRRMHNRRTQERRSPLSRCK